jgi:RNA polymerase sigma-70 factor (ECF subfamily)
LVEEAFRREVGPYTLQAAISVQHCQAARAEDTNWHLIVQLYDLLERVQPSPIVSLNRAVAVAMAEGPQPALEIIDKLSASNDLDKYHLLHATRADMLRRLGSFEDAADSYARALELATNESERRFLERRLREMQSAVVS